MEWASAPGRDDLANQIAHRQAGREPWRFHAGGVDDGRILPVASDQEVRKRFGRWVELRAYSAAREPQILERDGRQQLPRRLEKILDAQSVRFVVVAAFLIVHRRAEQHRAV